MEPRIKTAEGRAIDIHHHYVPPMLVEEAKKHEKTLGIEISKTNDEQVVISFLGVRRADFRPDFPPLERRLTMMEQGRITMAVVEASTTGLGYALDGQRGEAWCRLYNEGLREFVREHPDRFVALAAVPMQDPTRAAMVLDQAIRDLKFSGVMIASNVNGKYYNSKDFDPFWKKAQELDVLVVMHPENVAGSERMGEYVLRTVCGNPADSTLSLCLIIYSGVFDRFPGLKLCVFHGGGFFPYQLGRFDQNFTRLRPNARDASSPPSDYLSNLYFDTLVYRVDALDYLRNVVGADHLLFGTDYPFNLGDWFGVEKIEAMNCSQAEKEAVLKGNAGRLLRL